ncbi:MAG: FAD:protein FMN transferase [Bacteroidales bacterium]|nr:FAD:protein FMN transferase [Bacteroidales bacterium]MBK8881058.1 FAD:protein FMN transferase [Bacteroidales bacterium]
MNIKIISLLFSLSALFASCNSRKPVIESFTGFTQGTTYSIVYDNNISIAPQDLKLQVEKILHDFDMSLSVYNDSSVISRINRNEVTVPDSFFVDVFNKSVLISKMTDGAFDITVGPLVRAWGFGPEDHRNFSEEKRDSLLKLVGMDKVSIINGHIVKSVPGVILDVNAIAQGYSVDVVCRYFSSLGLADYLVEIGGEVMAVGTKGDAPWRIGIDKPEDNNMVPGQSLQAIIKISDKAVSTSGNYRKFYVEDGIKYSHTIDPKTGYPAKNRLLSATIIADNCTMADGIATACMVMGREKAIEFVKSHSELSAYFVFSDDEGNFKSWMSDELKKMISEVKE